MVDWRRIEQYWRSKGKFRTSISQKATSFSWYDQRTFPVQTAKMGYCNFNSLINGPGPLTARMSGVQISRAVKNISERCRRPTHTCSLVFHWSRRSHHFNSKLTFSVITCFWGSMPATSMMPNPIATVVRLALFIDGRVRIWFRYNLVRLNRFNSTAL